MTQVFLAHAEEARLVMAQIRDRYTKDAIFEIEALPQQQYTDSAPAPIS